MNWSPIFRKQDADLPHSPALRSFLPEQDRSFADVGSAKFRLGRRLALAGFFIREFYGRGGAFFYLFGADCCLFWDDHCLFLTDCCLFGTETGKILQSATLYAHFSESKSEKILCVYLTNACFGRKRIIHCHAQPYSPTFRTRKGAQKIFAAQTPQRKRGFFSTHQTIVGKTFPHLRSFKSSLADAPHCLMGLVSK